jgi:uncharacterized membrane-anchored protein YhcB (DUF1043 family)
MFGLGPMEILILLFVAGLIVGVVLLVVFLGRGNSRVSALEEEVRRLRDDLDRQRNQNRG